MEDETPDQVLSDVADYGAQEDTAGINSRPDAWLIRVNGVSRKCCFGNLYDAANDYLAERLPTLAARAQQGTQQDQIEFAQLADKMLYQIRSACATAFGLIGCVTAPGDVVNIELAGSQAGVFVSVNRQEERAQDAAQ